MNQQQTQIIKHPSNKISLAWDHARTSPGSPLNRSTRWTRHTEHTLFRWEAETIAAEALRNGIHPDEAGTAHLIPITDRGHLPARSFSVTAPAPADPAQERSIILRAARDLMRDDESVIAAKISAEAGTLTATVNVARPAEEPYGWLSFGDYTA